MKPSQSDSEAYSKELNLLNKRYHSHCLFTKNPPVEPLQFDFQDNGVLVTTTVFDEQHQSYDNRVHGGLIAAIIDASMTQCLMGHSVVAYTVDLSIKYKKPVPLHQVIRFNSEITKNQRDKIFSLSSRVFLGEQVLAEAHAKFFGEKVVHIEQPE